MKHRLLLIFRIVSIIIVLVCLIYVLIWYINNKSNAKLQSELQSYVKTVSITTSSSGSSNQDETNSSKVATNEEKYEAIEVDFKSLLEKNDETVGWIRISNTNIDFPIVKGINNTFYTKHDFEKKWNLGGWIFADYRNNFPSIDTNTIIFGHNRRNGTMFSHLNTYLDSKPTDSIVFVTKDHTYSAKIFSLYKSTAKSLDLPINFDNADSYTSTINNWKTKSIHGFDLTPTYPDKLLTICTCANNSSYRIVMHTKITQIK